jgi:flagellar hook-basal body complex protein FliE
MNISPINGIGNIQGINNTGRISKPVPGSEKDSFINSVKKGLDSVQKTQADADNKIKEALSGEDMDLSEVMISTLKAEISMQLTLQIRNKALDAYQEITRMSI